MAYDPQVVRAARARLEQRRTDATTHAASLRAELAARYPRLREIERELAETLPEITRVILEREDTASLARLQEHNRALQREMAEILHAAGYDRDNFEPQYTCPHCEDTGYVDGRICGCYQALLQEEACRRLSGLSHMRLTDFESMDLDYYDARRDEALGTSPRERMREIIDYCRKYAASFSEQSSSLLFLGPTGTGKTHLSLAIARAVTQRGFSVVYGSVQPLLRCLENEHFGRADGNTEEQLVTCELLILDDLGMEFDTQFSRASLYTVLNARLQQGRPTIISSNLSLDAMRERYGDQITSRLIGGMVPIVCVGKDIRQLIRMREMR